MKNVSSKIFDSLGCIDLGGFVCVHKGPSLQEKCWKTKLFDFQ